MKILAISDIHADFATFAPESLPDADVCLLAGDLTNLGIRRPKELHECRGWFDGLRRRFPVFWVPGNHDIGLDWTDFRFTEGGGCHVVKCLLPEAFVQGPHAPVVRDESGRRIYWRMDWKGIGLVGQSLCTAFDMPSLAQEWAYTTALLEEDLQAWADTPPAHVVVSHCPPFGVLDGAGQVWNPNTGFGDTRHIGSPGLRAYIERHQPRLVVCGHAHQNCGEVRLGRTRIVNTAQTATLVELEVGHAGADA